MRAKSRKGLEPNSCQALILYKQMLCNSIAPDFITFPFLIKECTTRLDDGTGRSIHAHVVKFGFHNDIFVQNSIITLYSECGFLNSSRSIFDEMSNRDVVSWNSLIIGYLRGGDPDSALDLFRRMKKRNIITWNSIITGLVQGGRPKEAFEFFHEMQGLTHDAVSPDKITIASVLSACASLGVIDHGKWVHSYLKRSGLKCDMVIGTALVDMYGKEAFDLFTEMESLGVRPNSVTFVGLLLACAHSGLVEKGRRCFDMMRSVYLFEPQVQHYACMVDILSRAALFDEVEGLIRTMPVEPDVFVWGALLGGCQMHGNVELGEKVAWYLIDLEPLNHAFYVILCDIYIKAGRYDDVKRIRALMNDKGIKKAVPGCSRVEIDGIVHEFSVRGSPEVVMEELMCVLNGLSNEIRQRFAGPPVLEGHEAHGKTNIKNILWRFHCHMSQLDFNSVAVSLDLQQLEHFPSSIFCIRLICHLISLLFSEAIWAGIIPKQSIHCVMLLMIHWIFIATSFNLALVGMSVFFAMVILAILIIIYIRALISKDHRPPVVGPMLIQLIHFKRLFDYQTSLAQKYSTFRLITPSHSEVYTVDPVNVEYMLKTNFSNYGKGEYNYGIMRDLFGDGIFAVDGEKWRNQRKLASYEFSTKVLRDFSTAVFRTSAAKLASRVSVAAVTKKMMDLQDLLMKSTLDSIFKVGFGVELNTLSGLDEFSNQFMKALDDSNVIVFWRYVDLLWRIKRFLNIGLEATLKQNIKIIDNFIYELIRRKREQMENGTHDKGKEDILSRFLMESEKDPENMTDQYLRDITLSFITAGKDTSANTLTWFFYMLCKHPLVQEKVAHEVREASGAEDNLSTDEFPNKLTEATLDKMQYLHAALTETLRLYPAVPVDGKSSENDDILPDGFKIKKGDGVNYMTYAMGRMKYIWGEDAEEFLPERWLDNGVFRSESPFKFTAFQAGPRICLGKDFAYRQMKILAAVLLFFFKFKLADESKEATYRTMFTLHMDKGLHLYVFSRL
ncbi:hypothetical protein F0562_031327 [Nyssa sinensis]|uniref:Uncharacterized protein n=1 Tax=Nyssa sinensis TaxID=561372 RepID=A0A5J5ATG9_9ASTE|nr:hypothetical protein F0562_031327 [Nyssa sinensis]